MGKNEALVDKVSVARPDKHLALYSSVKLDLTPRNVVASLLLSSRLSAKHSLPFVLPDCEAVALFSSHLTRRVAAQQRW